MDTATVLCNVYFVSYVFPIFFFQKTYYRRGAWETPTELRHALVTSGFKNCSHSTSHVTKTSTALMADTPRPPPSPISAVDQQHHKRPRAALTAGMNNPASQVQPPCSCSTRNRPEISSEMVFPPGLSPLPRSRAPC